jgi:RND family efflux transporter MFP subunit
MRSSTSRTNDHRALPGLLAPAWIKSALVFAIGIAGCAEPNQYVDPPPPKVTVIRPVQRAVTEYLEATGTAQPVMTVDVRARVKGFLKERLFKEGSFVQEGQLLLVIDEEPFRLALDQARLRLAESEASLTKAQQSRAREVARAQVALDQSQLSLAKTAEARQRSLTRRNAGTTEELDQAVANRKKGEAQVEAARAKLEQAEADHQTTILAAVANANLAKMAVRNAEIELSYCRMSAPVSGRISRLNYHVGNLVGDGQSSLLATIVKIDPIYALINVTEADLLRYKAFAGKSGHAEENETTMPMELGLASERGYPHQGHVDYHDPAADSGTGTVRMRGIFPNLNGSILPGFFVRVRIPAGQRENALLVPERALGTDQSGRFLLVVGKDDIVEYRAVTVGTKIDQLRVVEGMIGVRDRVIVDGLLQARPRLKVVPIDDAAETSSVAVAEPPVQERSLGNSKPD